MRANDVVTSVLIAASCAIAEAKTQGDFDPTVGNPIAALTAIPAIGFSVIPDGDITAIAPTRATFAGLTTSLAMIQPPPMVSNTPLSMPAQASSKPAVAVSSQAIAASSIPAIALSSAPVAASPQPPAIALSSAPAIAISSQPAIAASSISPLALPQPPLIIASSAPVVALSSAPAIALSSAPLIAVSSAPAIAISSQPAVAVSSVPPFAASSLVSVASPLHIPPAATPVPVPVPAASSSLQSPASEAPDIQSGSPQPNAGGSILPGPAAPSVMSPPPALETNQPSSGVVPPNPMVPNGPAPADPLPPPPPPSMAPGNFNEADYGETRPIMGNMADTLIRYKSGLVVEVLSPKDRSLLVTQNMTPFPGNFVSGATSSQGFTALQSFSYNVKTNEPANDLIAEIEIPYDRAMLDQQGLIASDVYVGKLAADGKSWVVSETRRNLLATEGKIRMVRMTSLAGEYILLGRKNSTQQTNLYMVFGVTPEKTVNITGGPGMQVAEWQDGLRFSVESDKAMNLNVDIKTSLRPNVMPADMLSLNTFAWTVHTTINGMSVPAVGPEQPASTGIAGVNQPKNSTEPTMGSAPLTTAEQPPMPAPRIPNQQPAVIPAPISARLTGARLRYKRAEAPVPIIQEQPPPGPQDGSPKPEVAPAPEGASAPGSQTIGLRTATVEFPINLAILRERLTSATGAPKRNTTQTEGQSGEPASEVTSVEEAMSPEQIRKVRLTVGRRPVNNDQMIFTPIGAMAVGLVMPENMAEKQGMRIKFAEGKIILSGTKMLEGEYVLLLSVDGQTQMAQQTPGGQEPKEATQPQAATEQPKKSSSKSTGASLEVRLGGALLAVFSSFVIALFI